MNRKKQHYFDKPENLKRVLRVFYIICAGLLLLDFIHHRHVTHSWENLWGFYGLFGFVACVVLVLVAKEMRKIVMRDEDYYDAD
jgi:hypothetical protein